MRDDAFTRQIVEPDHLKFGGGTSDTVFNPFVLLVVFVAAVLIWILPRSRAIVPFLALSILIPTDQILLIGRFHFPVLRILAAFGLIRALWGKFSNRDQIFSGGMNGIDKAFLALTVFTAVNGILLWSDVGATIFQLGNFYTAIGVYLSLRFLIRDEEDVRRTLRVLVFVTTVVAAIMICEQLTGRNPYYAALGGARSFEFASVMERDAHFRATGCFAHPILAGTFGGFCLPLFIGLWWKGDRKDRKYAVLGFISALVLPFAASSSTALFGFMGGFFALCLWRLRNSMRILRWGLLILLLSLHLIMKAPVWHLVSRVDLSGGSSSYHRYELINQCILHFKDWWLIGTKSYADWGWDMWDLSNQYAGTADTAGLLPLLSFLAVITFGFRYLGLARKAAGAAGDKKQELFLWAFGASLFANVVAFFGIDYFDQTIVAWYTVLAMICAVTTFGRNQQVESKSTPVVIKSELRFRSPLNSAPLRSLGSVEAPKLIRS